MNREATYEEIGIITTVPIALIIIAMSSWVKSLELINVPQE